MTRRPAMASVLVAALVLAACSKKPADTTPVAAADLIVFGGPIVTMEGDQPTTVEAIVVDDGGITFVGSKADALKQQADSTVLKDLGGKTLLPGFIDGHAHVQQFGTQAIGANLLAPPDGTIKTIDDIVEKLKTYSSSPDVALTGWIFGMGYDDALLGRHPTREDLDRVSTTVPVMATHISGHFAAVNTLGLQMIGYDASTPNPEGGVIRGEADGKTPNGVLEELAAIPHMLKALHALHAGGEGLFPEARPRAGEKLRLYDGQRRPHVRPDACGHGRRGKARSSRHRFHRLDGAHRPAANSIKASARAIPIITVWVASRSRSTVRPRAARPGAPSRTCSRPMASSPATRAIPPFPTPSRSRPT